LSPPTGERERELVVIIRDEECENDDANDAVWPYTSQISGDPVRGVPDAASEAVVPVSMRNFKHFFVLGVNRFCKVDWDFSGSSVLVTL
jgi:hypothetical protein